MNRDGDDVKARCPRHELRNEAKVTGVCVRAWCFFRAPFSQLDVLTGCSYTVWNRMYSLLRLNCKWGVSVMSEFSRALPAIVDFFPLHRGTLLKCEYTHGACQYPRTPFVC